jgi:hypothetical protein
MKGRLAHHYRKYIVGRDNNKCFLCGSKKHLEVHHLKRRGCGGKHDYHNLITLCHSCHLYKVHRTTETVKEYAKIFLQYTNKFIVPEGWQDVIMFSIREDKERLKKRVSGKDLENDRQVRKDYRQYQKLKFMEKHNGLSPSQFAYRQQKEYLLSLKNQI